MIYAIFLRGINTGKMKLVMSDFKNILAESGCLEVTAIQAAGTAVFRAEGDACGDLREIIETKLSKHIGKPVHSIIKNIDEIKEIIDRGASLKSPEDFHDYIMLTAGPSVFAEILKMHEEIPYLEGERLLEGRGYFIWTITRGSTLDAFGSKVLGSVKFREKLTSRNLNTMQKVYEAMQNHS